MNKYLKVVSLFFAAVFLMVVSSASGQAKYFGNWEKGTSPQEIGRRVAENFNARKLEFEVKPTRQYVIYPEICAWYGSLTVADLTKDQTLENKLVGKFDG